MTINFAVWDSQHQHGQVPVHMFDSSFRSSKSSVSPGESSMFGSEEILKESGVELPVEPENPSFLVPIL